MGDVFGHIIRHHETAPMGQVAAWEKRQPQPPTGFLSLPHLTFLGLLLSLIINLALENRIIV